MQPAVCIVCLLHHSYGRSALLNFWGQPCYSFPGHMRRFHGTPCLHRRPGLPQAQLSPNLTWSLSDGPTRNMTLALKSGRCALPTCFLLLFWTRVLLCSNVHHSFWTGALLYTNAQHSFWIWVLLCSNAMHSFELGCCCVSKQPEKKLLANIGCVWSFVYTVVLMFMLFCLVCVLQKCKHLYLFVCLLPCIFVIYVSNIVKDMCNGTCLKEHAFLVSYTYLYVMFVCLCMWMCLLYGSTAGT